MSDSVAAVLSSAGLSFYSIPAAWLLATWPHVAKNILVNKHIGHNNMTPRDNVKRLETKQADPKILAKARRLEGAHQNGIEALPLWIGAVLAANYAGVDRQLINTVSLAFLTMRFFYNTIYASQSSRSQAGLRSLVWLISTSMPLYLFVKAGSLLKSA